MDWLQLIVIIGANLSTTITLFLWARSEAREDQRELREIIRSIQDEIRDFHGRLCSIEERRKR